MPYVVTGACTACLARECIDVCPQQAFRARPHLVVIDPVACANCALCEIVCPVQAIKSAHQLTLTEDRRWREINARLAREWDPNIEQQLADGGVELAHAAEAPVPQAREDQRSSTWTS